MMRKIFLVIVSLLLPTLVMAQETTTYMLQKVTSVEAGGMYVFEQSGMVMIGEIVSSGINTTDTYNTSGLAGTESYVWTLESAGSEKYYIKNISAGKYINNTSGNTIKLGTTNSSKWKIDIDSEEHALITNTSNNDMFLGLSDVGSFYKAYAQSNLSTYAHAITVYQLVEEQAQQLTSIEVTTPPTKRVYEVGEEFNPEGMVVTATYKKLADGSTTQTDVTADCTYAPTEPLTTADEIITISYQDKTTTLQITVNPAPTYEVTLADMGVLLSYNDDGSTVTLPVRESMADYTFVGWSETECLEETTTCPELIVAGSYYPTKDVTLYPIFRTQSEGSSESWTLITDLSTLTSGTYALVVELDDGWHAFNGSISDKGMGAATEAFTFNNGTASTLPSGAAELTFTVSDNGILITNANGNYLTANATNKTGFLKWDSTSDNWILDAVGSTTILKYSDKYLRYATSSSAFRGYYSPSDGTAICVARKGSIVSHYVSLPYHQTINSYATLFLGYDAIIPDGIEAYIATASDKENTINLEQLTDVIPAMTGVVLKASAPATYTLLVSQEEATPCNNNLLCGVLRATAVNDLLSTYNGKSLYGLQLRDGMPFFARLVLDTDDESHNTLAAHRAVLVLDGPAPATELRVGDGDETGLHGIELGKKVTAAKCYDLTGRRAENGVRGWVIEDGRLTYKR